MKQKAKLHAIRFYVLFVVLSAIELEVLHIAGVGKGLAAHIASYARFVPGAFVHPHVVLVQDEFAAAGAKQRGGRRCILGERLTGNAAAADETARADGSLVRMKGRCCRFCKRVTFVNLLRT